MLRLFSSQGASQGLPAFSSKALALQHFLAQQEKTARYMQERLIDGGLFFT
jgi:hypothetical protein